MNPSIGTCVKSGLRTANQSIPAIAISMAAWIVAVALSIVLLFAAAAPFGAVKKLAQDRARNQKPPVTSQLNPPPSVIQPQTTPRPVSPEEKAVRGWIVKPGTIFSLSLIIILWISMVLWLRGGQIGYLSRKIRDNRASAGDFFSWGVKSFIPLLGARIISLAVVLAPILLYTLLAFLASKIFPKVVAGLFIFLGFIALVYAIIWVALKLVFYAISIASDRKGPLQALTFNLALTCGRMLHILCLLLVFSLFHFGLSLGNGFFGFAAKLAGHGAFMVRIVGFVVSSIAGVYLDYFKTAACITYYDAAKNSVS